MSDKKGVNSSSGNPSGPDLELKRAFAELQLKSGETRKRIKMMDLQVENEKRSITHASLTQAEVQAVPEGTRMYDSVGRMFVLAESKDILAKLSKKKSTCEEKIKTWEASKEYMEKSLKESENSLRELILQKKNTST